ncbi:MAG: DUF937 domain-containing protein [Methanothrix sp.]|uniref:DUF937 domain-containing protein n=1 Tax=Methanothrix sp. TaxID=90426 RepID=UPI003BB4FFAC
MDSVVNMALEQLMAGDNLSLISSKVGADEQSTKSALEMGLPLLLGAMSSKASNKDGANAILSGLAESAKGNSMQDMAKYLGSGSSSFGPGMLNSILGSSMIPIQQSIAKKTGLPQEVVGQLLTMALPLVLRYLTKSSPEKMKPDDLSKLLDEQSKMALSSSPDAEAMMKDILSAQDGGSGFMGMVEKLFKS